MDADAALNAVNRVRSSRMANWPRVVVFALITLLTLAVFVLGVLAQAAIGGWWTQRKLDQQNLYLTFRILQYNLEQGTLRMPPELQQKPPQAPIQGPPDKH